MSYEIDPNRPLIYRWEGLPVQRLTGTPCDMLSGPCACGATHDLHTEVERLLSTAHNKGRVEGLTEASLKLHALLEEK